MCAQGSRGWSRSDGELNLSPGEATIPRGPLGGLRALARGGLRAVTLNAADILGIEAGSLEVGKRADIIVTDGDPLQILTEVEMMWVGGQEVDPKDNKHQRLFEQFRGGRPPRECGSPRVGPAPARRGAADTVGVVWDCRMQIGDWRSGCPPARVSNIEY